MERKEEERRREREEAIREEEEKKPARLRWDFEIMGTICGVELV